jgi:MoaA/NifB/PqqE/SkfB family radical SAM enzyme
MAQEKYKQVYDAWLHWQVGSACNLKCVYCIHSDGIGRINNKYFSLIEEVSKKYNVNSRLVIKRLNNELAKRKNEETDSAKTEETLHKNRKNLKHYRINIPALVNSLNKAKKIFRVGFSCGEPFLVLNIIEACAKITEKHFVSFNTNLISGDIKKFSEKINPDRVVCLHASLHIKELERLRLVNKFIDNFIRLKEKGFNVYAQEVGYPPLAPEAEKYRRFFKKKGIETTFGSFVGSYDWKNYPEAYTDKELRQFGLGVSARNMCNTFGRICNAGYNIGSITQTGDIYPCEAIRTRLNNSNIYKKIEFNNRMTVCPVKFCSCPFYLYDSRLFKKAKTETGQK